MAARAARRSAVDVPASIAGAVAAVVTAAAIVLGSRGLRTFDAALVGYATATICLAFGVAYRYVLWVRSPPALRYLRRGWASFLSFRNFRRFPTMVPRALVSNLALQTFIARRGPGRWLAHQSVFWGVVLATLITFPLTFGWISFEAAGSGSRYVIVVWGLRTITFEPVTLAGVADLPRARRRRRPGARWGAGTSCGGGSATGRSRPASASATTSSRWSPWSRSRSRGCSSRCPRRCSRATATSSWPIIHMATVVLTLVFIPFGKFFHVIQRPASVGVEVYKRTSVEREGVFLCRRCGEPLEAATFVRDLETTMGELGLRYQEWIETCPRCKRVLRGEAYLREVKGGFQ